jgi:hypothetical protein
MSGVVYDAGALIAAERNDRALWADHRVRLEQGMIPIVAAAVIAQVSQSSRQAQLRRLLRGCDVSVGATSPTSTRTPHTASAGSSPMLAPHDVVDGAVAAAVARSAAVVTSDRADIAHLLHSAGTDLPIFDDR